MRSASDWWSSACWRSCRSGSTRPDRPEHGISYLLRGAFGVGAVAFPVVGVYWGVVLLRDVAAEDRVRMSIGFMVLVLGVLGLVSLFRGNPGVFEPHAVLAAARRPRGRVRGPPAVPAGALADRLGHRLRWGSPRWGS